MIYVVMIGRLRRNLMEVWGTRTLTGLRRLVSLQNEENGPLIDFTWELKDNSDHWSFYSRQIPILMLHTGLHDDYHRPSDDADKVNSAGVQQIARLMFGVADEAANIDGLGGFRAASRTEMPGMRSMLELALPALPSRLGIRWEESADGLRVTSVASGSPADRAGVKLHDVILQFADIPVQETKQLQFVVLAAPKETSIKIERDGSEEPIDLKLTLNGSPTRLGIGWRFDTAEPGSVILNRVVASSPAAYAGLRVNDRVYRIGGHEFKDGDAFGRLAKAATSPTDLQVERDGKVRTVTLDFLEAMPPMDADKESPTAPDLKQ
jgi:predicted metalloprotease with PDZ domain